MTGDNGDGLYVCVIGVSSDIKDVLRRSSNMFRDVGDGRAAWVSISPQGVSVSSRFIDEYWSNRDYNVGSLAGAAFLYLRAAEHHVAPGASGFDTSAQREEWRGYVEGTNDVSRATQRVRSGARD